MSDLNHVVPTEKILRLVHLGTDKAANDVELKRMVDTAVSILVLHLRSPYAVLTPVQGRAIDVLERRLQPVT